MARILFCLFVLSLFCVKTLPTKAQTSINAGAGSASGSSLTVDYTIGQAVHHTISDSEWTLIAGIQQNYEVYEKTGLGDALLAVEIVLYPNPAAHYIELIFPDDLLHDYDAVFYTLSGTEMKRFPIREKKSQIEITDIPAGTYFLQIMQDGAAVKVFKIIKKTT